MDCNVTAWYTLYDDEVKGGVFACEDGQWVYPVGFEDSDDCNGPDCCSVFDIEEHLKSIYAQTGWAPNTNDFPFSSSVHPPRWEPNGFQTKFAYTYYVNASDRRDSNSGARTYNPVHLMSFPFATCASDGKWNYTGGLNDAFNVTEGCKLDDPALWDRVGNRRFDANETVSCAIDFYTNLTDSCDMKGNCKQLHQPPSGGSFSCNTKTKHWEFQGCMSDSNAYLFGIATALLTSLLMM